MPARVFISCGQNPDAERLAAREVEKWLREQGYDPYLAVEVLSIPDLIKGIIDELKRADYYLFIDFQRELLSKAGPDPVHRGSLYSHQELAVAYALGFDRMIFLRQRNVERGGMLGTMVANTPVFDRLTEVLPAVQHAVANSNWSPNFSRHLVIDGLANWTPALAYGDHTFWEGHPANQRGRMVCVLAGRIANRRPDLGASSTVARLKRITTDDGADIPFNDPSNLKATSHWQAYSQMIWPQSIGRFDLMALDANNPVRVFLMSSHDLCPRKPVVNQKGRYLFHYQVFAIGFPSLEFAVRLDVDGTLSPPVAVV